MNGWIKLHRKILDWEWYTDAPVRILYEHLLLTANFEEKKWKGIVIKPGQLVTSRGHLAEQTGLSEQQVRTALEKLKKSKNITSHTTNRYTLITIENYSLYQSYDDFITSHTTNKQPTNNHNLKKEKIKKEEYSFQQNQNENLEGLYEN